VSTGTQETLDCLRDRRVLSLVADDSYAARGMHCRQCLGLFEPPQIAACPRCGSAELEPLDDLVEAALQQALDQKAAVTFIRDPDCRKAFTAMAPLCAWLRY
jgi:peptide subunit release factor 1 (eRF1)